MIVFSAKVLLVARWQRRSLSFVALPSITLYTHCAKMQLVKHILARRLYVLCARSKFDPVDFGFPIQLLAGGAVCLFSGFAELAPAVLLQILWSL